VPPVHRLPFTLHVFAIVFQSATIFQDPISVADYLQLMPGHREAIIAVVCALASGPGVAAQTVMTRTPNLDGAWVGSPGMLHFNFLHRFSISSAPERKVTATPTFLLAAGLPYRTLVGVHYATNSVLSPRYPNEWEFFGRVAVLEQKSGAPLDAAAQVGYNLAAEGPDGEASVARQQGPVKILAALRVLADPGTEGGTDVAVGSGVVVRLTRYLALSGDVTTLTKRAPGEEVAWGAGINLAIPRTPHSLSLQATNTNNASLQSSSRGTNTTRYGFEFTIPLTLSRYFGGGSPSPAQPQPQPAPQEAGADTSGAAHATVSATVEDFSFQPARLVVKPGTTVVWTNQGQVVHTVTAQDGSFESGEIQPGGRGSVTFSQPGTYPYHCTPHPFMKGVVEVR
jgi:plastocyanin